MTDNGQGDNVTGGETPMRELGRQAFRVAGEIRLLVERAEALGVNPEATPEDQAAPHAPTWDKVRDAADTLSGLAYAVAFGGDVELMQEITGRRWTVPESPVVPLRPLSGEEEDRG
jgi:hypothetical protein